jgi:hypothetical protein
LRTVVPERLSNSNIVPFPKSTETEIPSAAMIVSVLLTPTAPVLGTNRKIGISRSNQRYFTSSHHRIG